MFKYYEIKAPGSTIRCKVYFKEHCAAERAVIFCTGFAGHKDNIAAARFAEKLLSKDRNQIEVVFNWPAHGDDVKKKLVLEDCGTYLDEVIRDVKERQGIQELYAYATSFGGYLLLKYISEHGNPFHKIALRCPAVNLYDVLIGIIRQNGEYDRIMKGKDALVGFDRKIVITRSCMEEVKENDIRKREFLDYAEDILILHGTADEIVPFEESRVFADDNLIEFIPVPGADHRFQNPTHMSLANKHVMEFFGVI